MRDWTKTHDTGRCPKCKAIIERTAGCNHMKCRCRYEFCWLCGGEYTSNHFSQGLCRQFGGVGIGVKVEESSETLEPLDSHLLKMKAGFVGTLIILIFSRAYGARDDGSLRATFNVFYWLSGWFPSTILYLFFSYLVFYLIKHKFLNSRVPFCEIAGNRFLQFCLFLSPALLVPTAFLALRILNSITCSTISLLFMDKNILDLIVFVPSFMKLVFFRKTIWLIHSIFALLFCVFGAVVGKSISIRNNAIKVLLSVTWLTAALRMVIITLPGLPQIWIFKCYLWLTEKAATVIHLSVLHFLGVASGYFIEIVLLKLLGLHEPSSPVNIQTRMDPGPARTQLLKLLRFIPSDSSIETASRPALVVLHQGYLYALFLVVHNVDKMISSLFRLTPILNTAFGHAIFWLEYIPLIPIISLRKTGHFHTAVFNSACFSHGLRICIGLSRSIASGSGIVTPVQLYTLVVFLSAGPALVKNLRLIISFLTTRPRDLIDGLKIQTGITISYLRQKRPRIVDWVQRNVQYILSLRIEPWVAATLHRLKYSSQNFSDHVAIISRTLYYSAVILLIVGVIRFVFLVLSKAIFYSLCVIYLPWILGENWPSLYCISFSLLPALMYHLYITTRYRRPVKIVLDYWASGFRLSVFQALTAVVFLCAGFPVAKVLLIILGVPYTSFLLFTFYFARIWMEFIISAKNIWLQRPISQI